MPERHIPRKRFGQNFLKDQNVIEKIVRALHPEKGQNLVEIGAGLGALTKHVLALVDHLKVVEIDKDLSAKLQDVYPANKITVFEADALRFDFATLCPAGTPKLRIFGNLPYNISTPLLFHLLSYASSIQDMLFMLQKEVVMRMAASAHTHEYGRLSIMIQYVAKVHPIFDVSPHAFTPVPKVTSTVVQLIPYDNNRPHPLAQNEKLFSHLVTLAFSHRRKTLKNALEHLVSNDVFQSVGIDPIRRPETLSVAEFVALSDAVNSQTS
jgi:16S rRNA (adenine1518-N6/adenine1519-N6)-dimethyltransferase